MTHLRHALLLLLLILVITLACTSRYKYDLFQTADEVRRKVEVEQTRFVPNAVLIDPNSIEKFVPGTGNVVIVTTGTRGLAHQTDNYSVLRFDEYLRCDLYVEIANPVVAGPTELTDHAFLLLRGRYDQSAAAKLFLPESGTFSVDSLKGNYLYSTLRGLFRNADQVPLAFDGNVKVKYR